MNTIGRKLYYDKTTGVILADKGEMMGDVRETTFEEDLQVFVALQEVAPKNIGTIQLGYGEKTTDFTSATGVTVNLETGELEFDFTPPSAEEIAAQEQAAKQAEIDALKARLAELEG